MIAGTEAGGAAGSGAGTEAGGAAGSGAGTEAGGAAGSGGTTGAEDLQRLEGCARSVGESTLEPRFCLNDGLGGLAGCFLGSTITPPTMRLESGAAFVLRRRFRVEGGSMGGTFDTHFLRDVSPRPMPRESNAIVFCKKGSR